MAASGFNVRLDVSITYDPERGPYRLQVQGKAGTASSYHRQRYVGTLAEVSEKAFADLGKRLEARYRLTHKRKFGDE